MWCVSGGDVTVMISRFQYQEDLSAMVGVLNLLSHQLFPEVKKKKSPIECFRFINAEEKMKNWMLRVSLGSPCRGGDEYACNEYFSWFTMQRKRR